MNPQTLYSLEKEAAAADRLEVRCSHCGEGKTIYYLVYFAYADYECGRCMFELSYERLSYGQKTKLV